MKKSRNIGNITVAFVCGIGLLASSAVLARRPPPKVLKKVARSNAFAGVTDGLWSVARLGRKADTSIHFVGDRFTWTDASATFYGTFSSGKVARHKDGVLLAAHGSVAMTVVHGQSPQFHAKGLPYFMTIKLKADGKTANFCATRPGTRDPKAPAGAFPNAKNEPNVQCYALTHISGPALASHAACVSQCVTSKQKEARGADAIKADCEKQCSSPRSPKKKRIKIRTRGLDWSLGR